MPVKHSPSDPDSTSPALSHGTLGISALDLTGCMSRDRVSLQRLYQKLQRHLNPASAVNLKRQLTQALQRSQACFQQRRNGVPAISYPAELPICDKVADIISAIQQHRVVIVAGDTGSGKSTQLPKICLQAGRGVAGYIGHTQPRRIAARSIAARLCEELSTTMGREVGFKVRFDDQVNRDSYVKLMTDGILLSELQQDRDLYQYDTLIIDEAHERSLNIDFLIGYLKGLVQTRSDLKLIITSATIDTQRFAEHFHNAPIVKVEGRTYPVEVRFQDERDDSEDPDLPLRIRQTVDHILEREPPGDILVFLSGEAEIKQTLDVLSHPPLKNTLLLPLFSRLSNLEQQLIFQPCQQRKIVMATNIAETSLTIPGIKYVVDTGYARISRYSYRSKVQMLPIEKVSKASADQRKGRCGRVSNGVCFRLYSEQDFLLREDFTEPEIKRTNLAAVILQMEAAGLGDIRQFPFIDPPDPRYINDGYKLLHELAAVDAHHQITPLGRRLARFPIDPRLAKMLLGAEQESCLAEVLIIVSALTIQDVRERPLNKQDKAAESREKFCDKQSDFLTYVTIWRATLELKSGALRKFCRQNYLNFLRVLEWRDIHGQLARLVKEMKLRVNVDSASYNPIHRAILSGLITLVGLKVDAASYMAPRNTHFVIGKRSCLAKNTAKWVMTETLIHTGRVYAFNVAKIHPKWLETAAEHLLKRDYFDADWDEEKGRVIAYERCMLYGLPVHLRREVDYGRLNPSLARDIFIQKALVERQLGCQLGFYQHNLELIEKYENLEAKHRVRNIIVNDDTLYDFYQQRIPAGVCSLDTLQQWLHSDPGVAQGLHLDEALVAKHKTANLPADLYPDTLSLNGHDLPLSYAFEPGTEEDGVSVTLPVFLLHQYQNEEFDCLVPGLLGDKIIALIKSLPKSLRTSFIPATNFAERCLRLIEPGRGLLAQLTLALKSLTGITIPIDAWQLNKLPVHFSMRFRILDEHGELLAVGRDLNQLRISLVGNIRQANVKTQSHPLEIQGLSHWSNGLLPEDRLPLQIELPRAGHLLKKYPAMCDRGEHVDIVLLDNADTAQQVHRAGLCRLFRLRAAQNIKYFRKNISHLQDMALRATGLCSEAELRTALEDLVIDVCLFGEAVVDSEAQAQKGELALSQGMSKQPIPQELPRELAQFEQRCDQAEAQLLTVASEWSVRIQQILDKRWLVLRRLDKETALTKLAFVRTLQDQLGLLFPPQFISVIPNRWLRRYSVYLEAILLRIERHLASPAADTEKQRLWQTYWERYLKLAQKYAENPVHKPNLVQLRWMLEEYRISLFAQGLKTAFPVSPQRLEQLIGLIHGR